MNFLAGLFIVASVALVCLKLAHVIVISWLVAFIPAIVAGGLILLGIIITALVFKSVKKRVKKYNLWDEFKF